MWISYGRVIPHPVTSGARSCHHQGMSELLSMTAPDPPLRDTIVVTAFRGWNDAARAASTSIATVAEQLDAEEIGTIDPEEFYDFQVTRPIIDLTGEEHTLSWPR